MTTPTASNSNDDKSTAFLNNLMLLRGRKIMTLIRDPNITNINKLIGKFSVIFKKKKVVRNFVSKIKSCIIYLSYTLQPL